MARDALGLTPHTYTYPLCVFSNSIHNPIVNRIANAVLMYTIY